MNKILIITVLLSIVHSYASSIKTLNDACEKKSANACYTLGGIYDKKDNIKQAAIHYRQACELNHALGCNTLAELYLIGAGVTQSDQKFIHYMQRSCQLGYKKSCTFVQKAKPAKSNTPLDKTKPISTIISQKDIGKITFSVQLIDPSKRIVQINASMQNLFAHAAGWLSFSFPDIKKDHTLSIHSKGFDHIRAYPSHYSIYHVKQKKAIPSSYLLVEGEAKQWEKGEKKSAQFQIKVPAGIQRLKLYVRGTFKERDRLRTLPIKGTVGQQGFYNKVITLAIGKGHATHSSQKQSMTIDLGHLSASNPRATSSSALQNTVPLSRKDKLLLLDKLLTLSYYHRERKAFEKQLKATLFGGTTYLSYIKSYTCTPKGNRRRHYCVLKLHGESSRNDRLIQWEFHAAFTATKDEEGLRITEMHSLDLLE